MKTWRFGDGGSSENKRGAMAQGTLKIKTNKSLMFEFTAKIAQASKRKQIIGKNDGINAADILSQGGKGVLARKARTFDNVGGMAPVNNANNLKNRHLSLNVISKQFPTKTTIKNNDFLQHRRIITLAGKSQKPFWVGLKHFGPDEWYNNNMKKPLVSVIVPIYNVGDYLRRSVCSILEQSYENLEVILVDDGSTDGCNKIVDEFARVDKRVVAIHQKNAGQSSARNAGIKAAHGEFLSFIDGDDEIQEDFVEKLVEAMNGKALAVCGMIYRRLMSGSEKRVYVRRIHKRRKNESLAAYILYLLTVDGRMYSSVNKLYRADVVRKNKLKFEEGRNFAEDTKFVLDYLKYAEGEIGFALEPLYIYNFGTETSTVKKSGAVWENWQKSYDDLREWVGDKPSLAEKILLKTVLARWRVSHWRTANGAK